MKNAIGRVGVVLTALLVVGWAPVRAQSVLEVVRAVGLLGTWAERCNEGASPSNWFITYYVTGDSKVRRMGERGSGEPTLDGTVDAAEKLTPTMVRLRLRNDDPNWGDSNGRIYDTILEVQGGRSHSLSSIGSDGTQYIKEGKFVGNGQPTPVLQRCRN